MLKLNKEGTTVGEVLNINGTTFDIITTFTIHAFMTTDNFIAATDKSLNFILSCNHINSMQPEYIVAVTKIVGDMHYTKMDPVVKAITLSGYVSEKLKMLEAQGIVLELD